MWVLAVAHAHGADAGRLALVGTVVEGGVTVVGVDVAASSTCPFAVGGVLLNEQKFIF